MANSSRPSNRAKESRSSKGSKDGSTLRNSRTTVSGHAEPDASGRGDVTAETTLPNGGPDTGVLLASAAASVVDDLVAAMAKHRHFARETDPPRV